MIQECVCSFDDVSDTTFFQKKWYQLVNVRAGDKPITSVTKLRIIIFNFSCPMVTFIDS